MLIMLIIIGKIAYCFFINNFSSFIFSLVILRLFFLVFLHNACTLYAF